MSRTLKWVLGIVAVLVILAVAAGVVWVFQNRALMMASVRPNATLPNQGAPGAPNFPNNGQRGFGYNGRNPNFGYGYGFGGPMARGMGRMMRFGPFGMGLFFFGALFRWFLPLLLLVLVAVIFYQLGKRSMRLREPVPAPPAPPSEPTPPQNP